MTATAPRKWLFIKSDRLSPWTPHIFEGRCGPHRERAHFKSDTVSRNSLGSVRANSMDLMRGKTFSGMPSPILSLSFQPNTTETFHTPFGITSVW